MINILQAAEFWALIAFIFFVVAVFKPARKLLVGALDQRVNKIRVEVEDAEKLLADSQSTLARYQSLEKQAVREAETILNKAKEEAKIHQKDAAVALETLLKRQEKLALDKIALAEIEAQSKIKETLVDLTIDATGKLLTDKLKKTEDGQIEDAAIKKLLGKFKHH